MQFNTQDTQDPTMSTLTYYNHQAGIDVYKNMKYQQLNTYYNQQT